MKRKLRTLLLLVVMIPGCAVAFAEDDTVTVAIPPFFIHAAIEALNKAEILQEDPSLFDETLSKINQEVQSLGDMKLSPKEYGNDEAAHQDFWSKYGPGLFPKARAAYEADIVIITYANLDDSIPHVGIQVIGVETGKEASASINTSEINQDNFTDLVAEKMVEGLEHSGHLMAVHADELIHIEKSIVRFVVTSTSGEGVEIDIDYAPDKKKKVIQNVSLSLQNLAEDGMHTYEFETAQDHKLTMTFAVENKEYRYVKLDTDYRPENSSEEPITTLQVTSREGYQINFEFAWEDADIKQVKVYPEKEPYGKIYIDL